MDGSLTSFILVRLEGVNLAHSLILAEHRKKMYTRAPGADRDEASGERPLRHKIEHPWIYDTDIPTAEPPDINYKNLIRGDQKEIDDLLEDDGIHFTERCLRYQALDVELKEALLGEYGAWKIGRAHV